AAEIADGCIARAGEAEARGNVVRAALLLAEAARSGPAGLGTEIRSAANWQLALLVSRLRAALDLLPEQADRWYDALLPFLDRRGRGIWPVAARLLYDLQKVCINHERGIYAVDLVEWALSLGRRPVKRPLPYQRDVLILKHLRKADRRLARVRLA